MNFVKLAITRPIFVTCIFTLIIVVGVVSFLKLPVDQFPDVTFPVVMVSTPYPGAGPQEVETLVSKVIENELSSISGMKNLKSVNKEGISIVIAEFLLSTDVKYAEQQVRDKVSNARRKLPEDALESSIKRLDPADQAVVTIGVSGNENVAELYDFANEYVKPLIQQVEQVGQVDLIGGRRREIHVELDQTKLHNAQISASTVAARIGAAGENIPAGLVSKPDGETVYRTLAEFRTLKDIESVIVNFFANERGIRVKELGQVIDTLQDETARVYLNKKRTTILLAYKQSGSNTISVVNAIKKKITQINKTLIDGGKPYRLEVIRDNSKIIKANVDDVEESIFLGIFLTIVVVLFFLGNIRSTIITSLALPNSLLGAFILMAASGFTINIMSLLALSLSVGLLIDDAIVVRENIFRHLEMGKTAAKAAFEGTIEVTLAVVATTMTVIAVFGPIGFLDGVVGQFFKQFGLTICFAMAISLFDALTMAPMMSSYFAGKVSHNEKDKWGHGLYFYTLGWMLKAFDRLQTFLEDMYEKVLVLSLRFSKSAILMGILLFIGSIYLLKFVPKTFLPAQDNGEFQVKIELLAGSSLDQTQGIAEKIEAQIRTNPEVEKVLMTIGSKDQESHLASFYILLVSSKQRKLNTTGVKDLIRQQLKPYAKYNPIITDADAMNAGQRPFTFVLTGSNLKELEVFAYQVFEKLKPNPALKDVNIDLKPGKPEFQFVIDVNKAEQMGVSTKIAGQEMRTLVEGLTPAVLRQNGIEYDIRVRLNREQRDLRQRLNQIFVPNINNRIVPITAISKVNEEVGPATINRQNRNRSVTISADIATKGPGLGGAITEINRLMTQELKPPPGINYGFQGQAENFQELMVNMAVALALGTLFIYMVLASLYESFITPFAIMLVLPLALVGAFAALFLFQRALDLFSMIGCILLLGVATKNSILLVDYTNQLMALGMDRSEAIIKAGRTRLRPILMTSFALIAGMLPVAIGLNEASKQRTSMGVAIIGGLISSTLLTLVIVPAAFSYFDRLGKWLTIKFQKVAGSDASREF